ncbi:MULTISPECIES: ABC transporter ATP-binding protein [Kitasatospora]|uniref:Peptide/nickel transport system ATP-binding protein n=2 Tax=Kitasatospora TaxID=2063 RepID=A0ABT1IQJ7_9ACTN|nr:ABC transporter ATP-binding protein [Kitasatospora paracochleata]MCP2307405.1 peptide/nickel transport system ATP-binding protein [Kitasatospora paracochleata]
MSTLTKPEAAGTPAGAGDAFLSVRDLRVRFRTEDGIVKAVNELNFDLEAGKTLGIVGESGSGKSVSNLAVMGLHNPRNTTIEGSIKLEGQELIGLPQRDLEKLRGNKMAMIFQDSLAALSPYYTIGRQIAEPFMKHTGANKKEGRERAIEMLAKVGIPQPDKRVDSYPHEFSGGMRQRAMIAMSLVCNPKLLIADEPTTALDVTVQAQIVDLLKDLQQEFGTSIIFITHDLGVIREIADDVLVMYAGRAVERGTMREILKTPQHPYGWGLLSSIPRINASVDIPLRPIPGSPPSLLNPPSGCAFNPRCEFREQVTGDKCRTERPALEEANGHLSACHLTPAQKQSILTEQILPRLSS